MSKVKAKAQALAPPSSRSNTILYAAATFVAVLAVFYLLHSNAPHQPLQEKTSTKEGLSEKTSTKEGLSDTSLQENYRRYKIKCDTKSYKPHIEGCTPKFCARVIVDGLVSEEDVVALREVANRLMSYGGGSGGVTIVDLHSGALSQGDKFVNLFRLEGVQFPTQDEIALYNRIRETVKEEVQKEFGVRNLYFTEPAFFSRMNNQTAKTMNDEYWHDHIDAVTYGSFTYTALLYLNTHDVDFTGGEFNFHEPELLVTPKAGRVSFFTSGAENPHNVHKVTSGTRLAVTISFTCNKKAAAKEARVFI